MDESDVRLEKLRNDPAYRREVADGILAQIRKITIDDFSWSADWLGQEGEPMAGESIHLQVTADIMSWTYSYSMQDYVIAHIFGVDWVASAIASWVISQIAREFWKRDQE